MQKWNLAKLFLFVLLSSSVVSSVSFAQAKPPAAGGAGGGSGVTTGPFELYASSGVVGLGSSASQFDLSPGFQFKPITKWNWLQVGGEITYQKLTHQSGSTKNMLILGGITLNLSGATTNDASFVSLGIADRTGSSDLQDTEIATPDGMGFYLIAGRRFSMGGPWCFRPTIGVVNTGTSTFIVRPLGISYHF